jgi:Carboxypeptidase regulatory-like domain
MKKLFILFLLSVMPLMAQTDRATVTGTVTDPSGRRVVGANLVITSDITGLERLTKTNEAGVYTVSSLDTGSYNVTIDAQGFSPFRVKGLTLDVGQTRTLDARLDVAGEVTQVEVNDSGLSKSSAEIGGVVHGKQAQDLSLNGRSFVGLVSLVPGAIDSGTGTQQDVRFAGLSDEDNTWHLDGVDNSGVNHQYQKVDLHLQVSTESIAEFRANGVAYSADQGGSVGGQIEVVSKTGGAQFHGAAWEFIRNNFFDATPWGAAGFLPALRRNNFGANLGGPILKNKLFFFANYEAVHEILNTPITGTVPSVAYRAQVAAQQPVLAPLINAYPIGQIVISPTSATFNGTGKQVTREDSGLIRVDYHVNDRMSAFLRFNTDVYTQTAPDNLPPATGFNNLTTPNAVIGVQNTFTSKFFNDFRFGFNRAQFLQGQTTPFAFALQISPFTSIGNPSGSIRNDNSFSGVDDVTLLFGRHTIKTGVTIRRVQENKASPNFPDDTLEYTNTTTFLHNLIDSDTYNGTVPLTGQRMTEYFGYILDQYKLSQTLNLNVGLRYEYFGVNHEVLGRGISVDPLNCPNVVCPSSIGWYSPNLLDLSPRISAAWSPDTFHGKTVFRTGFGIYYGFGQFGGLSAPISNLTSEKYTLTQAQIPGLGYPVIPSQAAGSGSSSPSGAPINRRDTAVDEWTLSIQQEVAKQTIFQIAYFGTSVSHAFSDWTLNGINPATEKRPFAGYSTIDYRGTFNHGSTNAFQTSLQRNVSKDLSLSANYEWSHSIDNGGIGGGEADAPQNMACLRCERASSDQDLRSYLSASGIWQLPVGRGRRFLNSGSHTSELLFGGWQMSGIESARSGLPLNVTLSRSASALPDQLNKNQRPNVIPGASLYPTNKSPQNWLNYAAFTTPAKGTWGNLGRNAVRGPRHWQVDPALSKRFAITERIGTTFRAEAFNVFNHAQYGKPAVNWAPAGSVPNPNNYGVITTAYNTNTAGSGGPRDLQFSLKMDF